MPLYQFFIFALLLSYHPSTISPLQAQTEHGRNYKVHYYDLSIHPDIQTRSIKGNNRIHMQALGDLPIIELDLAIYLRVDSIFLDDSKVSFTRTRSDKILIKPDIPIPDDQQAIIHVYYQGNPTISRNPPWDGGMIWTLDSLSRPWIAVACEGIGASSWWPCDDRWSSEADSMRISILTDSSLFAVSNGVLTNTEILGRKKRFVWKVNYPINNYCATINIGAYTRFSDTLERSDGGSLAIDYYVLDYNLTKARRHFRQVPEILRTFEHLFGRYPFEKDGYALVETPYWGMEHQSAIAYGNDYKNNFFGYDYIIVHESAHEWWGNQLTADTRENMWIHEAFATYSEILLLEKLYGKETANQHLLKQKTRILNQRPIASFDRNVTTKDTDQYYKGSWMLHTIRNMINDDTLWLHSLRELQRRFAYQTITRDELINTWSELLGVDLHPVVSHYLDLKDLPELLYHVKNKKRSRRLRLKWNTPIQNFSLPVFISDDEEALRIDHISGKKFRRVILSSGIGEPDFNHDYILYTITLVP